MEPLSFLSAPLRVSPAVSDLTAGGVLSSDFPRSGDSPPFSSRFSTKMNPPSAIPVAPAVALGGLSTRFRPVGIRQLNVHALGLKSRTGRIDDVAREVFGPGDDERFEA